MLDLRLHLVHANVFVDLPGNCICTTAGLLGCALPGSKGWCVPHCGRVGWGLRELLAAHVLWLLCALAVAGRSQRQLSSAPSVHTLHPERGVAQKPGEKNGTPMSLAPQHHGLSTRLVSHVPCAVTAVSLWPCRRVSWPCTVGAVWFESPLPGHCRSQLCSRAWLALKFCQ